MPATSQATIDHLKGTEWQQSRSFSPAVVTQGGRTVWLAGQTTLVDMNGNDITGNFEAQARTIFQLIARTLERVGGTLENLVTMTVFINDPRNGDRFVEIRGEFFPNKNYPASALVTLSNFARPGCVIEIQSIAVI
ncbi:MAG: endoribonuclease [Burkholderiales bacterium]|jgi:enamine deaminase RidA (YjgF/YER057c/UK114 family)|nr:endoribonuclease [Burkholderiales bacterium]